MTEEEWLACEDPEVMLKFVSGEAGERRLRLFASASFLRLKGLLPDPRQHRGLEVLHQLAEGTITKADRQQITAEVRRAIPRDDRNPTPVPFDDPHFVALMLYREFCSRTIGIHAINATGGLADGAREQREQVLLLRDIFGNPFRPVTFFPEWRTTTVLALAQGIYDERAFGRMPILADALGDAGCSNEDILNHCRSETVHTRGCWCIDLILGRE